MGSDVAKFAAIFELYNVPWDWDGSRLRAAGRVYYADKHEHIYKVEEVVNS